MAAPLIVPNEAARALILARTHLSEAKSTPGAAAAKPLVEKLGYVQLDSIRVVERAQHHILFARNPAYRPKHLERAQKGAPVFFEHWTHDASLIPMEHYPHWRHRFAASRRRIAHWRERFGDDRIVAAVRSHIERHGAVKARDLSHLGGRTGPWWGWGLAKSALEFLWRTGELAVVRRDGFEKIYDLSERLIPRALREAKPSCAETLDWACNEALDRLGAATPRMLADFWGHASIKQAADWIASRKKRGQLIDVVLCGATGRRHFNAVARPNIQEHLARLPAPTTRLRALSPFDPLLRDRDRAGRIFDFEYRIEVYVPGHKRAFGYYVFPLLEGARLVGRIDMKAEREKDRLLVKALWLEGRLSLIASRRAALERELARQARLANVGEVLFPEASLRNR